MFNQKSCYKLTFCTLSALLLTACGSTTSQKPVPPPPQASSPEEALAYIASKFDNQGLAYRTYIDRIKNLAQQLKQENNSYYSGDVIKYVADITINTFPPVIHNGKYYTNAYDLANLANNCLIYGKAVGEGKLNHYGYLFPCGDFVRALGTLGSTINEIYSTILAYDYEYRPIYDNIPARNYLFSKVFTTPRGSVRDFYNHQINQYSYPTYLTYSPTLEDVSPDKMSDDLFIRLQEIWRYFGVEVYKYRQ
ncbi:hypothetical protein [Psittacicella gerlachiana]|uniref:Lipoprotein n=1 Tax=Psittacicella gerlachiana TaxID=2028574 RepID=A0A3A1YLI2_9GAMM|nr:hypothetical protein [Psittacicella gerlachiana]RIY37860.1 hypothetical protein CKF59_01390 [Psittacicella gerlachiana]